MYQKKTGLRQKTIRMVIMGRGTQMTQKTRGRGVLSFIPSLGKQSVKCVAVSLFFIFHQFFQFFFAW